MSISQLTDPDEYDSSSESSDENTNLCKSNSMSILPSQIENIVKAKPVFVKKIMPNDTSFKSQDENTPLNRSNSMSILPTQISNIIKAKPVFVKKVMPSTHAKVPNFSTNMKQKLQEFQQVFSQEIPTVEQASNFTFKKPAGVPKKKSGIGMLRCFDNFFMGGNFALLGIYSGGH